eukprot:257514-Chlamydomonas_euryale.AAC.1
MLPVRWQGRITAQPCAGSRGGRVGDRGTQGMAGVGGEEQLLETGAALPGAALPGPRACQVP